VIKIHDPDQVYIRNGCILMHTGGCSNDSGAIFTKKNLKINIDRKLYWIVHFYLDLCCASSEWYSNIQNYEVKQCEQGRVENSSCKPQKAK
jgi:hypothetical protein